MSIFDDDFYSTKVSRRTVRKSQQDDHRVSFGGSTERKWSNLRVAFISSFTSAVAAALLFGLIFGGFGGGGSAPVHLTATGDPSERTIVATAKVKPAVVSVINEQMFGLGIGGKRLENGDEGSGVLREAGVGSGVIIEKKAGRAFIVTNYHVVANAEKVKVVLTTGEVREARVVGMDQITDLAVLEIDAKGIDTVAEIGNSSELRAAEFVMAIGNPLGMGESITMGVVSVIKEVIPVSLNQNGVIDWEQEVIRVDAAINQGNSGGPLIDLNGRVVGINSMKISDFGVESIGYAIPINNAMPIVESLISKGYVPRPYLGVYTMDLEQYWEQQDLEKMFEDEQEGGGEPKSGESSGSGAIQLPDEVLSGVIVLEAVGPSKEAGLTFNDVIVKLDDYKVSSTMELRKYLYSKKKIGEDITVSFYRDGELQSVKLKLEEQVPEE
ncbi:PDZ domain-containing protein [Paenibacillus sp. 1011MAR3C5]|uniref:S1C family serine protease n=1 Tax=Paenibacillus sp. 1011MAR3C5 TaxID=1675787 RepID=UPI000E6CFB2F|nr:trypsin-like peptidase domain-containing protein [Paenibacillus sp. 1011MAR3C5]RJE83271.1 PDZ domain-containing protein [Paenibacillus sp. 1011MAR3C5]